MKKRPARSATKSSSAKQDSEGAAVMRNLAQNLTRKGYTARALRSKAANDANRKVQASPVPSCPEKMLERIEIAKQHIEESKERAKKQRREYVPVFCPIGFTEVAVAIFERLACNANMEPVWKALVSVFDDTKRRPDTWAFADFCYQNIGVWEHSPKRTRAQHKKYFESIADDLMSCLANRGEPEFGAIGSIGATVRWVLPRFHGRLG